MTELWNVSCCPFVSVVLASVFLRSPFSWVLLLLWWTMCRWLQLRRHPTCSSPLDLLIFSVSCQGMYDISVHPANDSLWNLITCAWAIWDLEPWRMLRAV